MSLLLYFFLPVQLGEGSESGIGGYLASRPSVFKWQKKEGMDNSGKRVHLHHCETVHKVLPAKQLLTNQIKQAVGNQKWMEAILLKRQKNNRRGKLKQRQLATLVTAPKLSSSWGWISIMNIYSLEDKAIYFEKYSYTETRDMKLK